MKLTDKQQWGLHLLTDSLTVSIGYGGAAGGGKSVLGVYWLLIVCSVFSSSKWFIGRDSLKDTQESVLFTFRKVSKMLGMTNWRYTDNHIKFDNGSEIEFLDMSFYPRKDPMYERFGSKEYTGGWIEEAGPVHPMAYEVIKTRINRWNNKDYGIIGKILVTFNPRKNWVDSTFYRPFKNKIQDTRTKFVPALAGDNEHLDEEYLEILRNIKDKATRERLLHGNFDYDDDPTSLISYLQIASIFTNTHVVMNHQDKCLICDVARYGSDDAIITVWYGLMLVEFTVIPVSSTAYIQQIINAKRRQHQISADKCLADDDGVGGGVVDNTGIVGFKNGGTAPDKAYYRLKDQCGYKLADIISEMYFAADLSQETQDRIEMELAQLKTFDSDKDGLLRILPKVKIKENIGHSPDWLDIFIMRAFYYVYDVADYRALYNQVVKYL